MEKYNYLLPTLVEEALEISGPNHTLSDTTLNAWFHEIKAMIFNGKPWSESEKNGVRVFAFKAMTSFCSDPKKIKEMQGIFKNILHSEKAKELMLFVSNQPMRIPDGCEKLFPFDPFFYHMTVQDFSMYIDNLFLKCSAINSKPLKPYLDFMNTFHESQGMQDLRDFLESFGGSIQFTTDMSSGFDSDVEDWLQICKGYPKDSDKVRQINFNSLKWAMPSKVIFISENGEEIDISEKKYLEGWDSNHLTQLVIPNYVMIQALDLSLEKFLNDVVPSNEDPLQVTFTLSKDKIDIFIEESTSTLRYDNGQKRFVPMIISELNTSNSQTIKRSVLQKKCIGNSFKFTCSDDSIKSIKEKFFRPFIVSVQKNQMPCFEKYLTELRYFSIMTDYFIFSRAALHTMLFPKVLELEENKTFIENAKNPVLIHAEDENLSSVVGNDINIESEKGVILITGPNQNGKTRYMDTVAMFQVAFQAGWPIFADSAEMSPKTNLRVHYVHSGVGLKGQSRFSHECQRMRETFSNLGEFPMILMDEPYTGTNPTDAEALLKEVLQATVGSNVSLVLTSHFHNLIPVAGELKNASNLHCVVDEDGGFTYKIRPGSSTYSNALDVASTNKVRYEDIQDLLLSWKKPVLEIDISDEDDDLPF